MTFFIILGAVSAAELNNVTNIEDSNLIVENQKLSISDLDESGLAISSDDFKNESLTESYDNTLESSTQNLQTSTSNSTNTTKTSTKLAVYNPHYSKAGTIIKVSLKDDANNTLSNKKLTLSYNGKTYKSTTEQSGFAYFKLASLKVGTTMSLTVKFNGDAQYAKKTLNSKVKVKTSVVAKNLAETYGDKKAFPATFYKDNGKLKNTTVTFKVNSQKFKVKTNSLGVAEITKNLKPGTYTRVVCIGAGALRMYTYVGDVDLLCGIEDIDNTTREARP